MIYYEPIPIFEAHAFLSELADGFSDTAILQRNIRTIENAEPQLSQCYNAMLELNNTLSSAVKADKSAIDALYAPLSDKSGTSGDTMFTHTIASCFMQNGNLPFKCYDENAGYELIRENAKNIPAIIFGLFFTEDREWAVNAEIKLPELIELIYGSDYNEQAKLSLISAAANPEKYAEKLIALLKPVVKAFRECRALYAPLIQIYRNIFVMFSDEKSIIQYFWKSSFNNVQYFDVYPMIMMPTAYTIEINYPHDGHGNAFFGFLSYWLSRKLMARDVESEALVFMDALANKNRIRIISELAKGKKFGRELADELHLTTGSISQSLTQLFKARLVKIEDVGSKGYCSIDQAGVKRLIHCIEELFAVRE